MITARVSAVPSGFGFRASGFLIVVATDSVLAYNRRAQMITTTRVLALIGIFAALASAGGADFVTYQGKAGPGAGKHIVFLSGDEEYRSEEALPQLAKILAERHGFKCTVLFAINPADGTINPNVRTNLPGAEALDSADAIVMALRFREWPDPQMKHFVDAWLAGKPIIALRTSTHAFNYTDHPASPYAKFSFNNKAWPGGFGKQVLGETWVAHHGAHKKEATRGVIEPGSGDDPILRGVTEVFGNSDVYTANPPADAKILVRGQVLAGMNPTDPPVQGKKNDPMQPVVWTRLYRNEAGATNKILCTTMGAATDLENEGLRRLLVNAVYWGTGLAVPDKADVALVGEYKPTMYGFDGFIKGTKPAAGPLQPQAGGKFELKAGDHVALIGNTLADRFQHSGWLETFLYNRFPGQELVFRNLAVAGDEVAVRHRPDSFGSADEWLRRMKADVIFAFFGFNESFHGAAGLAQFKADLDKFLKETAAKNYSGKAAPRVVLFSPIANERHLDPNLPDPNANNANLGEYTAAMKEVAEANGVPFVDLFHPSQEMFATSARQGESLTINGLHLTDQGDRLVAQAIFKSLFGEEFVEQKPVLSRPDETGTSSGRESFLEKLRGAVNEKNEMWHSRYRTIDGNNVYGGRSALSYQPEKGGFITDRTPPEPYISNFKIMQEEMTQRDVMTANRDRRVWAVARGGDLVVNDTNLPPVTRLKSNHPGPNPDETFPFLGGEEAIAKMKVHSGMKVNLFASEEQFPELAKPVQMAWDTKGRLWVAAWPNYPERTPESKVGDSLLVFEDTNGDGKADKCTHFIDDLNGPTGFQFYKDGVLLMQAPDLWFIRDTNGDGKADSMERVLMGMSSADSHHTANSMCLEPGGAVYLSDGVFHRTQVETAVGPVRNNDAAIFRFEPRTGKFERYAAYDFANPHGRVFDYWGSDLITDGTGNNTYFGPAFSGRIDYPDKHRGLREFWNRPSRPCAATGILTSRHFPEEFQGNFLNCNVIGFQGIYRVKVNEEGSGLKGERMEDLVSSSDPNFRPVAVSVGPDGAVYFCDWQNPIIGHMQHHLRDPNRDHDHGRVYRITYGGRDLLKQPRIDGQPIPALLELLKQPENQVRELAKVELGQRPSGEVVAAVKKWAAALDPKDPSYWHNMAEALWVHQWHNVVDLDLLKKLLRSTNPHARAAATRVLCYWRDQVPDALVLLKTMVDDENPRVRLEAVRAASFFSTTEAVDVALAVLKHSTDYYLDYTVRETLRQLRPWSRKALETGQSLAVDNPVGRAFLLQNTTTTELLKLPRSPIVLQAILTRSEIVDADRMVALGELAGTRKTNLVATLLAEVQVNLKSAPDAPVPGRRATPPAVTRSASVATLARLLPFQSPEYLRPFRSPLAVLARNDVSEELRQAAWMALALADGSFEKVWADASKSAEGLSDLLGGIPSLPDPAFRAKAYDNVKPLVDRVPAANAVRPSVAKSADGMLRRAAIPALVSMNHEPEAVFASLTDLITSREAVFPAAQGLSVLPRASWSRSQAGRAANGLIAWARKVPVADRTSQDYCATIQLAGDLAGLLPANEAAGLLKDLKELRVSSFFIRTVREQMRYDTPRLVVEAGKPFEILFENADFMPHNLVLVKPNTRDKVGLAAASMKPEELDSEGRAYVPGSPEILAASKMLLPGQRETLKLTAPSTEGDHEYFCTFPGHYQVMWGRLIVTRDVDAYLQAHPEAPIPVPSVGEEGTEKAHDHQH
jgi:glucose/arabinose dehydrogenase/azurin